MASFPGPPELGRGIVVGPDADPPPPCAAWPRVEVTDATVADPRAVADRLHDMWLRRQPVFVVLSADPEALRTKETEDDPPWRLDPDFEFSRERLQYLVWSNNYDARQGPPVWWHGRRAERLGAAPAHGDGPADGDGDVVLPDGTRAWCDGGPRQPLALPIPTVHRETLEAGSLTPDRTAAPTAALAPDQLGAVSHVVGPARIIAPAGSGKTRVLTERLRHLLADRKVTPNTVTAVAYNKRAADELAERTHGLPAHIRTLNSLGLSILQSSGRAVRTIEEMDVRRILESLIEVRRQQNTDPWAVYIEALSAIRLGLADPKAVEDALPDAAGIADAFDRYRAILADRGLVDFDEQIYAAIEVLLREPEARQRHQRSCRHLLVDEFQDLTPAHLLMLRLVSAPTYDVFGVGDDDQVIYSYAGATPEFLIGYERSFPGASQYALTVNYRCPPAVIDGARHLLSYNRRRIEKVIEPAPDRTGSDDDLLVAPAPAASQAAAATDHLRRWREQDAPWTDMAVLARVNSALLPMQVTLVEADIPCMAPLNRSILQRTGIRAALAYLRIGLDPDHVQRADVAETIRRPSRRIARNVAELLQKRPTTSVRDMRRLAEALSGNDVDRVHAYADDLQRVVDSVRAGDTALALNVIRTKIGLGAAMDVLDSSRGEADRSTHGDDLAALEQVAALHPDAATFESWLSDVLSRPGSPDGVTLSTVHRVKGREWPHVIVFGANEGLFPHRLSQDVEEERRVFHVAVTRARAQAVVVADPNAPSPFCAELSGTAPRVQLTAPRSTVAVKPKAHANASVPMSPPQPAALGLAVTLRGGIDAVVVDVEGDERGVVVTPVGGEGRLVVGWGTEVRVAGATVRLVRPGGPSPEAALAALKAWRKEVSARDKVPAYIVFSDDHLSGIASTLPGSLAELAACRGVGPAKLERYGDDVLRVIEETPR